ncbi:hypothetical protein ACSEE7_07735 [Halomonas cupida]|uniref:hypothetical protein n=1 Tax=Halomonas cupida TaxID=44933 RepID=UPI003EF273B7
MDLERVRLFYSPLTDTIFMSREGKRAGVALDKRPAEADVMGVLVQHMMHDSPNGSMKTIQIGEQRYEITVKPVGDPADCA